MKKKKICIIYTGGTIGMAPSENGYVPSEVDFEDTIGSIRDLHQEGMPQLSVIQFSPLLDSSNISIPEWNKIAAIIGESYDSFDGFVILHGTDTMAYSASALSFMLEGLDKPVIFTGAQIPLCRIRSDGYNNLISSVLIASEGHVREVCIYFDGKLLRACRSTKMSSSRFEAFSSPNCEVLAEVGIDIDYRIKRERKRRGEEFKVTLLKEIPVGIIKMFPGIQIHHYESIMTESLKGVVLESFGAGNIPANTTGALLPLIDRAYQNGTVVVVCSQCMQGSVSLGAYQTSKSLVDIGAVNGADMTSEAAMTKLIYLLSKGLDTEEIKEKMKKNLRGELTERI